MSLQDRDRRRVRMSTTVCNQDSPSHGDKAGPIFQGEGLKGLAGAVFGTRRYFFGAAVPFMVTVMPEAPVSSAAKHRHHLEARGLWRSGPPHHRANWAQAEDLLAVAPPSSQRMRKISRQSRGRLGRGPSLATLGMTAACRVSRDTESSGPSDRALPHPAGKIRGVVRTPASLINGHLRIRTQRTRPFHLVARIARRRD